MYTHGVYTCFFLGEKVYGMLKRMSISSCEYIFSGSEGQDVVAKRWCNDEIKVLISTTLGLVGNESSKTQLVVIVGMLYNLPSIVQSIGRVRPMRRKKDSLCCIYTSNNNFNRMVVAKDDSIVAFRELVGCGILEDESKDNYMKSMTMSAVNKWLFVDKGCRMVSLALRLGYKQEPCHLCDICTDTCVKVASVQKKSQMKVNNKEKVEGIRLLTRLKRKCMCCNSSSCNGLCVVRKLSKGLICFHCLGKHRVADCDKSYKKVLHGKACFSCYVYNYSPDCVHDFKECSKDGEVKERLRGLIHYDYCQKNKENGLKRSFVEHLSCIYASESTFFKFLYKYKDCK